MASSPVWRLRGRSSFDLLRSQGLRARRNAITVTWVRSMTDEAPRVGYAVGRRVGGAVQRNRVRRRLRAVTHEISGGLAPGSYLISAGSAAFSVPYAELRSQVSDAAAALASRAAKGPV